MKHTLILFEDTNKAVFFKVEKNLTKYNEIYIGEEDSDLEKELSKILFNNEGEYKLKELNTPTKDWTWFIRCGNL